ncbi:MAG TPA: hypothetical protein DCS09_10620 [Porphyromonadaceae bacterium]|jgi:predicted membrane protein|nr:hypothetical protein [Porphyromonadaceae bacterium]HBB01054.1 hypothetical protein [Porphyromonadaceae bacterium]HCC18815.1 hypothetical protein [Porphyromonadaceae bacterium]
MESNSNVSFHHSPKSKGVVFGLLLIIAGFLFLSFNFGWIDAGLRPILFSWPMIFVLFSIINFAKRDYSLGIIFLILGLFFLVPRIATAYPGYIPGVDPDFSHTFWPVLLILLGVIMVFRVGNCRHEKKCNYHRMESDVIENVTGRIEKNVLFGGSESIFLDPVFNGGEIHATFGGVVLDLRKTTLPEGETCLDIDATFGGVELYIPGDWLIETRFHTVLGGVEDKRLVSQPDYSRRLILTGNLTFGGCEIR